MGSQSKETMAQESTDLQALMEAMDVLTRTSQTMEEAYRRLEQRLHALDRELAEKNRELAVTSDYLGNILESMSDGVIAVNTEEVITRFNRAAATVLGHTAEEVVGRSFAEVFGRDFSAPKNPGALELKTKSGRMAPLSERDSPMSDRAGNRVGMVKTFQDLSEIIALREQVRQMDRLAAVGEMAASVAHEIRNPLGGIRGFAAFLMEDIPEDDPRRRMVEKIQVGAKSLDKVVNGLLEYTRPVDLSMRSTNCAELVTAAIGFAQAEAGGVAMVNTVDPALQVLADPDNLRRVFLNILINGAQSMKDGGSVEASAKADGTEVTVSFRDTGCGIPEDELARIFSPFFTTKEKGTGLGLAVCAKIVEGHGGAIEAESVVGEGTAIHVRLPRAE